MRLSATSARSGGASLSSICAVTLTVAALACQTTVNVTGATDTSEKETETGTGATAGSGDATGNPGTTNPGTTDPGTTDPGTTNPSTTDPSTTNPGTTGPNTTDSGTTNPNTTDPGTTDANTTDGGTTDPGTTGGTTEGTTGGTTSGSSTTTGNTTGDVDPGCGNVPDDMACVPANTFEMGTDLDVFQGWQVFPNEQPGHTVTISKSFWIDLTEVTVEDYAVCWALKICELPKQGPGLNWGVPGKEKHPANGVNWYQAKTYCEWKGKRLPTEAEWELAARGDDGRMFSWGNDTPTCEHVVSDFCGTSGTEPVGSKPLGDSPYGLHDMTGNVLEWCSDYYKEDYYYESPGVDPKGPMNGTSRSLRSIAAFVFEPDYHLRRATARTGGSPLGLDTNPAAMGLRCAQTPP